MGRGIALLVEYLEEDIVLLGHVVRTSAAVLHRSGGADVRGGLLEEGRVQFIIAQVAQDGLGGGDIRLVGLSLRRATDCNLQMEFLQGRARHG